MTKPFQYQLDDAKRIIELNGRCLLASSMGLGKSFSVLLYLKAQPELRPAIVVCPASLKWNWENEAIKHLNMRSEVLEGIKPPRGRFYAKHPLIILNYDILYKWVDWLRNLNPQVIILDETHYLAGRTTRRTKAVQRLCKGIDRVVALSGTPLVSRPVELFPTLNLLRPDLFPSFWPFGMAYCGARRAPWGWTYTGATNLNRLHHILSAFMIRRTKEEVLKDLPEKSRFVLPLELPKQAQKEYLHAQNDFVGWLLKNNPGRLSRASKAERLVQLGYLKRLAGYLKVPLVISWIEDFLENQDGKLVVFGIHKKVLTQLETRFSKLCVKVDGSVMGRNRQKAVDQFQKKPSTRLFLGNIKAAGVGLNLTAASTVVFAECAWTPGAHAQAEDRCHRIGTKNNVECYYLVARETLELSLVKLLQQKQTVLSRTLDGRGREGDLDIYDLLSQELLKNHKP